MNAVIADGWSNPVHLMHVQHGGSENGPNLQTVLSGCYWQVITVLLVSVRTISSSPRLPAEAFILGHEYVETTDCG